ncbi:MAG: ThuA domain-containing protein [Verrucomicrobiales bacterium]
MKPICSILAGVVGLLCSSNLAIAGAGSITYEAKDGAGKGKHVVLIAGDEEYRSEEGLPMLGKILSQRNGFKCTVLFSVNDDGVIDPENQKSLTDPAALDSADAIIILLRFRQWDDAAVAKFDAACERGVPIIGLRTSTHAFLGKKKGFGKRVLGEGWVSNWGSHKKEGALGVVEPGAEDHPILRGCGVIFGDSDVYEAYPPEDAEILLRGLVVDGMTADSKPAKYKKKRRPSGEEKDVNDPPMPVAWTRDHKWDSGKTSKIFTTTLGAATDLQTEGTRRMVVNSVFWGLGMEVPEKADVSYVDPFEPTFFGFGTFRKGILPEDHALGKTLKAGSK